MSVTKHTDAIPDPRAVNQDKKNMLFSVSPWDGWALAWTLIIKMVTLSQLKERTSSIIDNTCKFILIIIACIY